MILVKSYSKADRRNGYSAFINTSINSFLRNNTMKKKNIFYGLSCVLALWACGEDKTFTPDYTVQVSADSTINATINTATTYQTIDGFAASDAWTMDYIGKYWDTSAKAGMAKLLFSQNLNSGTPEGIGLSMWRVNVGGGTAEQGDNSGIDDKTRRAECFLTANGTYDWTKAQGQQYFMQQAKAYGCNQFVLFSNTPPVYFTRNGKGYSDMGAFSNLKDDSYAKFADFLSAVALHFQQQGYTIPLISPVNEPQYNWTNGQEGSGWQNSEVARLAKELDKSMTSAGLNNTKMLLAEAGGWNYLYETNAEAGSARSNVINDLFNQSSQNYIGNLKHASAIVCAHSYWTDLNWSMLSDVRTKVRTAAQNNNLKVYQTEWSMLGSGYEDAPNYDNASYMDLALAMSKVIHQDLATANASSWSYWTSAAPERWSQKSRFYLIRITPADGDYGDMSKSGTYSAGKNLWVLGNYSLFVRPGYQRVDLSIPQQSKNFFGSAYLSPDKTKLVVVYTNATKKSIKIDTNIQGLSKKASSVKQYTTSAAKDLKLEPDQQTGVLPAKSVATLVYELN